MQYQEFAERHPFQVIDAAGKMLARFSNLSAAMAYAKWAAEDRREDFDVIENGQRVGRCESPVRSRLVRQTA